MFCVSLFATNYNDCYAAVSEYELVEIRFDSNTFKSNQFESLFKQKAKVIACCRSNNYSPSERAKILTKAIHAGALFVDIDVNHDASIQKTIFEEAKKTSCKVILSYHNFTSTPDTQTLISIINRCKAIGADIIKIACMVNHTDDNNRLLSMYQHHQPLISFGMGELGSSTRLASLSEGAPFAYVSICKGAETAPGQMDYESAKRIIDSKKIKNQS